jgi:hypothetical protein
LEYHGFPEDMEENITPLLEAYDWQTMNPMERWQQEQLIELEEYPVPQQLELIQEEIEQLNQIEAAQQLQEDEQTERNYHELIQLEQWEQVAFLLQQLNEH